MEVQGNVANHLENMLFEDGKKKFILYKDLETKIPSHIRFRNHYLRYVKNANNTYDNSSVHVGPSDNVESSITSFDFVKKSNGLDVAKYIRLTNDIAEKLEVSIKDQQLAEHLFVVYTFQNNSKLMSPVYNEGYKKYIREDVAKKYGFDGFEFKDSIERVIKYSPDINSETGAYNEIPFINIDDDDLRAFLGIHDENVVHPIKMDDGHFYIPFIEDDRFISNEKSLNFYYYETEDLLLEYNDSLRAFLNAYAFEKIPIYNFDSNKNIVTGKLRNYIISESPVHGKYYSEYEQELDAIYMYKKLYIWLKDSEFKDMINSIGGYKVGESDLEELYISYDYEPPRIFVRYREEYDENYVPTGSTTIENIQHHLTTETDTITSICNQYNITFENLTSTNNISDHSFDTDKVLIVKDPTSFNGNAVISDIFDPKTTSVQDILDFYNLTFEDLYKLGKTLTVGGEEQSKFKNVYNTLAERNENVEEKYNAYIESVIGHINAVENEPLLKEIVNTIPVTYTTKENDTIGSISENVVERAEKIYNYNESLKTVPIDQVLEVGLEIILDYTTETVIPNSYTIKVPNNKEKTVETVTRYNYCEIEGTVEIEFVASAFNMTVDEIRRINDYDDNKDFIFDEIVKIAKIEKEISKTQYDEYEVQLNDTLKTIAESHNTTVLDILLINNFDHVYSSEDVEDYSLQTVSTLIKTCINNVSDTVEDLWCWNNDNECVIPVEYKTVLFAKDNREFYYITKQDDTLYTLSDKFGLDELCGYNNLDFDTWNSINENDMKVLKIIQYLPNDKLIDFRDRPDVLFTDKTTNCISMKNLTFIKKDLLNYTYEEDEYVFYTYNGEEYTVYNENDSRMRVVVGDDESKLTNFIPNEFPRYIELTSDVEHLKLAGEIKYDEKTDIYTLSDGKIYIPYKEDYQHYYSKYKDELSDEGFRFYNGDGYLLISDYKLKDESVNENDIVYRIPFAIHYTLVERDGNVFPNILTVTNTLDKNIYFNYSEINGNISSEFVLNNVNVKRSSITYDRLLSDELDVDDENNITKRNTVMTNGFIETSVLMEYDTTTEELLDEYVVKDENGNAIEAIPKYSYKVVNDINKYFLSFNLNTTLFANIRSTIEDIKAKEEKVRVYHFDDDNEYYKYCKDEKILVARCLLKTTTGRYLGYFDFENDNFSNLEFKYTLTTDNKLHDNRLNLVNCVKNIDPDHGDIGDVLESLYIPEDVIIELCFLVKTLRDPDGNLYYSNSLAMSEPLNLIIDRDSDGNEIEYSCAVKMESNAPFNFFKITSDIINPTLDITSESGAIIIKDLPVVGKHYLYNYTVFKDFFNTFDVYYSILKDSFNKLENNTNINLKFYNTYGPSKHFHNKNGADINTNITMKLSITLIDSYTQDLDFKIKNFILDFVEKVNEKPSNTFAISNLIRELEKNFEDINYIEFEELNGQLIKSNGNQIIYHDFPSVKDMSKKQLINYVPEYLNVHVYKEAYTQGSENFQVGIVITYK